eukprot:3043384-Amphidinium_carterae.1
MQRILQLRRGMAKRQQLIKRAPDFGSCCSELSLDVIGLPVFAMGAIEACYEAPSAMKRRPSRKNSTGEWLLSAVLASHSSEVHNRSQHFNALYPFQHCRTQTLKSRRTPPTVQQTL